MKSFQKNWNLSLLVENLIQSTSMREELDINNGNVRKE